MENRNTTLFFLISLLFSAAKQDEKIVITKTIPGGCENFSIDKYISGDKSGNSPLPAQIFMTKKYRLCYRR